MLKSLLMPIVTEKERQCNELRLLFDDEIISKVHGIENIDYTLKKAAIAEFNQNYYHYMLKGENHDIVVQKIGRIIQGLGFERSIPSVSTPPNKRRFAKGRLYLHMDAALSEFNDSVAAVMKSLADFEIGIENSAEKMRFQLGGLKISLSKDGGGDDATTGQESKKEDLRGMKKTASEDEDDSDDHQTVSSEKTDQHSLSSPSTASDPSIDARSAVSKRRYHLETSSTASDPSMDDRSEREQTNNLGRKRSMLRLRRNVKGSEDGDTSPPQKMDMPPMIIAVYPGPIGIKVKIDKKHGGAVVKSIDQDSPLKGVEVGDRIVEIDGRKVRSNFDFAVNKGKKRRFKVVKAK